MYIKNYIWVDYLSWGWQIIQNNQENWFLQSTVQILDGLDEFFRFSLQLLFSTLLTIKNQSIVSSYTSPAHLSWQRSSRIYTSNSWSNIHCDSDCHQWKIVISPLWFQIIPKHERAYHEGKVKNIDWIFLHSASKMVICLLCRLIFLFRCLDK